MHHRRPHASCVIRLTAVFRSGSRESPPPKLCILSLRQRQKTATTKLSLLCLMAAVWNRHHQDFLLLRLLTAAENCHHQDYLAAVAVNCHHQNFARSPYGSGRKQPPPKLLLLILVAALRNCHHQDFCCHDFWQQQKIATTKTFVVVSCGSSTKLPPP